MTNEENVNAWINANGFTLIKMQDNFNIKYKQDRIYYSDKEGYKYCSHFGYLRRGGSPRRVYTTNPYTIENIKLWLKKNNRPFELISQEYPKASVKMKWHCQNCGNDFTSTWGHILHGRGCRYCQYIGISENSRRPKTYKKSLAYTHPDLCKEWDNERNQLQPTEYSAGSNRKVYWICPFCNKSYKTSINHRTKDMSGCPYCNLSHGEYAIIKYLDANNIPYISQCRFADCRYIKALSFDFYLPTYRLCIEFQGEQHIRPYDFATFSFDTDKANTEYNIIVARDAIKKSYCNEHNLDLLEIMFYDIRRIPKILDRYFEDYALMTACA